MKIDPTAQIHGSVIIEGDVEIGAGTVVGAHCYLKGPLRIGNGNTIAQCVMIGVDTEHKTKAGCGWVTIGNGNVIREFSVVQRGIGDLDTEIQDGCYIMAYAYVAHDCLIESDAIVCARVSFAGHCSVLRGAILGVGCSFHHYTTVGDR